MLPRTKFSFGTRKASYNMPKKPFIPSKVNSKVGPRRIETLYDKEGVWAIVLNVEISLYLGINVI